MRGIGVVGLLVVSLWRLGCAFYLPGIAPSTYEEGMNLTVYADKLSSTKNQVPYEYFSLPFRRSNRESLREQHLNLGELLLGERHQITDYEINMNAEETCKIYCTLKLEKKDLKLIKKRVADEYLIRLHLDNLPAVVRRQTDDGKIVQLVGFPIGFLKEESYYLFNHLIFVVKIHRPQLSVTDLSIANGAQLFRVVGFEVRPETVKHRANEDGSLATCPVEATHDPMELTANDAAGQTIHFTYDVKFEEDLEMEWATRWDPLLQASTEEKNLQRFYIVNSLSITLFLTLLVAMILTRTVYLDYARYNDLESAEDAEAESGWKQVYGDVFRPPVAAELLVVLVGNGMQITIVAIITLCFALLGFWTPAYRGGLLSSLIFLWVLTSAVAGYISASLYTQMDGKSRRMVTIGSCFIYSGFTFSVFFFLNIVLALSRSSAAVKFGTLLALLFIWLLVSVPLNILGAFLGYRRKRVEYPCKPNHLPRDIPEYAPVSPYVLSLVSGVMPFGVVFVELAFLLDSLWQHSIFYMFGFLFAVFILLVVTCAEVSMVMSYLVLSQEDYRWWWSSFLSSGSSGLYVLGYSFFFLFSQQDLRLHFASFLLFTGYTLVIAYGFTMMAGSIGFMASNNFVQKMFKSIRID